MSVISDLEKKKQPNLRDTEESLSIGKINSLIFVNWYCFNCLRLKKKKSPLTVSYSGSTNTTEHILLWKTILILGAWTLFGAFQP